MKRALIEDEDSPSQPAFRLNKGRFSWIDTIAGIGEVRFGWRFHSELQFTTARNAKPTRT